MIALDGLKSDEKIKSHEGQVLQRFYGGGCAPSVKP